MEIGSKMASSKPKVIIYFPPSSFSPRFSNSSLLAVSAEITGWTILYSNEASRDSCSFLIDFCRPARYIAYHLLVKTGREQYILQKRYSDFSRFSASLQDSFQSLEIDLSSFPAKTILYSPLDDESGLISERENKLGIFLDHLLGNLNQKGLMQSPIVTQFLGISS